MVGVFYEINPSFILPEEDFEFYDKDMQEND
jgi:hypothetical protein